MLNSQISMLVIRGLLLVTPLLSLPNCFPLSSNLGMGLGNSSRMKISKILGEIYLERISKTETEWAHRTCRREERAEAHPLCIKSSTKQNDTDYALVSCIVFWNVARIFMNLHMLIIY